MMKKIPREHEKKFLENMKYAARDACNRIEGVPYGGNVMSAYVAPSYGDWVIPAHLEDIRKFVNGTEE